MPTASHDDLDGTHAPTLQGVDFFCGAGGMTNGLLKAGIDVIAGVDNHLPCKDTYERMENNVRPSGTPPTFVYADVSAANTVRRLGEYVTPNDDDMVFAGCSPCQFWSKINTSKSKSKTSRLLLEHFQSIVYRFKPGYVVVENVPGIDTRRNESGLTDFLSFLTEAGYGWDEHRVVAYRYGVPQKRRRFLLVATRLKIGDAPPSIRLPEPSPKPEVGYPAKTTVREILGVENGFPKLKAGQRVDTPSLHWAAALSEKNLRRLACTRSGGDRSAWSNDPELQIPAYQGKDHIFRDVYGRMRWDEPASTITTRFNSISNGRFGHPAEHRAISLREGARLQTFPMDYVFPESFPEAARQIGNAVPPELAFRIGQRLVEHRSMVAEA